MVTSLKNLKNEVDSRLAGGGLTDLACCQLQNAETILDNNVVTSVANVASLPSNTLNEGTFVYVDDIKEYRLANDASWTDDVSSGICIYQNQLWGWGFNNCGSLGDGTVTQRCSPVREFCSATDWCQVGAGTRQSTAIKTSGEIWVWGSNQFGGIGDGTITTRCSPVREICSATDWCAVSVGHINSIAIKTSGELWAWGNNSGGWLGDGTDAQRCSPVREFCSATNWCQAKSTCMHAAALKTDGTLWTWGGNSFAGLGDGTTTSRCSPVREFCSATDWCYVNGGFTHTVAIKTSGELWAWGSNNQGQTGDGTTTQQCSPVREICSATDWCQVTGGSGSTAAIKTSGELWAWGVAAGGQLGDGTTTNKCSPVREFCSATNWCQVNMGNDFSVSIKTSGQLWTWGVGSCGRLGDSTITNRCSPVRELCSATDWCQASAGFFAHTLAINSKTTGFLE